MSVFEILFAAGGLAALVVLISIAVSHRRHGNAAIAGALFAGFSALTAYTIAQEGVMTVIANHTVNFWGIQVWYDLLFAVGIALFFIAPRARAVGMNIPLWVIFVGTTASIGLLAMIARLFILERGAESATATEA